MASLGSGFRTLGFGIESRIATNNNLEKERERQEKERARQEKERIRDSQRAERLQLQRERLEQQKERDSARAALAKERAEQNQQRLDIQKERASIAQAKLNAQKEQITTANAAYSMATQFEDQLNIVWDLWQNMSGEIQTLHRRIDLCMNEIETLRQQNGIIQHATQMPSNSIFSDVYNPF